MRRAAWARAGGIAATAVVIAVALSSCSSSSKTSPPTNRAPATVAGAGPTSTMAKPAVNRTFTLTEPDVAAFNTPAALPHEAKDGAQALLDEYLDRAVVTPLQTGHAGDLAPLFTAAALERVSGPDRPALVDDGVAGVTDIAVAKAVASLTALVGPEGVHLLVAGIDVVVTGKVAGTPIVVARSGEMTLLVDADAWKISSYDVKVDRDVPQ